jgi:hypothetical protein
MMELFNPAVTMANVLVYVQDAQVKDHWRNDARPAAMILIDLLLPGARISSNLFLASITRSLTVRVKRMSQYQDIWDIGIVLDYIRRATPIHLLSWKRQKARCAWLLMVFVPLRMSAMWRLDPATERRSEVDGVIEADTREETDTPRSKTVAVIRPLEDKRLCPVVPYLTVRNGAKNRGAVGTLFRTEGGKPYVTNDTVRHGVEEQMYEAGIYEENKANTTRHATFSALWGTMTE